MQTTKNKFLRILTSVVTLVYFLMLPQAVTAASISEDVEDAVEEIENLQDEMNDLEEEIDKTYGTKAITGIDVGITATSTLLYKTTTDATWTSSKPLYKKGTGKTATTVEDGDLRLFPYQSNTFGDKTVEAGDPELTVGGGVTLVTATNILIGSNDELYEGTDTTTTTTATNRVTNKQIVSLAKMTTHFTEVTNAIEDAQDELDDLKGETIPTNDLGDLEDAVNDLIDDAETVIDMIEEKIHSNLNDEFDDKREDFDGDIEDLEDDLSDVKAGLDTDNEDVDDFIDKLADIESNVNDVEDTVTTDLSSSDMQSLINNLTDEYDDAEDEIDDLDGEEFTSTEQTKITNAWDDLKTAFTDALDEIEDNVEDNVVEDDFNDERDDFEDDLEMLEDNLNSILSGEGTTGLSNRVQNSLDDLDEYKDDLKALNRVILGTYGDTVGDGDEDDEDNVTGITMYRNSSENNIYARSGGSTATTPQVGDIRVLPYSSTYRAGVEVNSSDPDTTGITGLYAYSYYTDGSATYTAGDAVYSTTPISASATLAGGETRTNRAEIMYLPELQDIFSDIEDVTDDYDDALRDLQGEELSDTEITKIDGEYNSFKDKADDYISDLEDLVHSTLDDYFEDLQDDHDRNMEDLDTIVEDIKEGTESTIAEKINDFVDELSDVEDDITAVKDSVTSTISDVTVLRGYFDDLSDYLDDAEGAVEDLEGETYSDAEKKRATDAFSDVEDAFTDAMDTIEDNLDGSTVEDEFDTEKDDLESDIDAVSADLASILKGGGTTSQAMNNLIDDIKDARDDIADILDNDLEGMSAGSITDRTEVRGYSDDIQDALDDAVDSLTEYDGDPSTLGINRLKSTINSLGDKKDDTLDAIEDYLDDDDNLEDTFDDEKDDVDSKWDEVEEAAQLIYDRAPLVEEDEEDEEEEDEEGAKDEDGDGTIDFSDVSSKNPFKEYIDALTGMDVIKGYSDGSFKPNNQVTRGEFLKMVTGASEADLETVEDAADFTDVKKTNDFYQWINYAASEGFIKGYSDGSFKPYAPITRFEAVVILLRFKGVEVSNIPAGSQYFIDVSSPSLAGYTDAAFEEKILSGYPDNTFRPQNNITRGETSKIVVLAFS